MLCHMAKTTSLSPACRIIVRTSTLFSFGEAIYTSGKWLRPLLLPKSCFKAERLSRFTHRAVEEMQSHEQERNYKELLSLIPRRIYNFSLDTGCGSGLLAADLVADFPGSSGIQTGMKKPQERARWCSNMSLATGNVFEVSESLYGRFDLIVADISGSPCCSGGKPLRALGDRVSKLLMPDGICLLITGFASNLCSDTGISTEIYEFFASSETLSVLQQTRSKDFVTILLKRSMETGVGLFSEASG